MEQRVFQIVADSRGRHWDFVAIYSSNEVNLKEKKSQFNEQKCIFEHCRKVITIKNLYNHTIFFIKIVLYSSSELPSISFFIV